MDSAEKIAWHRWRNGGCGGSDAPLIYLGKLYNRTVRDLFAEKTRVGDPPAQRESPEFRRGHTYEPRAVELFEERTGIRTYYPADDAERYGPRYCLTHPEHPHRRVSLDGICADGWIAEVKSPRQFVCDRIRSDGLKDNYLIQAQYQADLANATGTFAWEAGECKGTRLIIYEPENVDILVVEIPRDPEFAALINGAVDRFWTQYVIPGVPPPAATIAAPVPAAKASKGKYAPVDGPAWTELAARFRLVRDAADAAAARLESAKAAIRGLLDAEGKTHVLLPDGQKYAYDWRPGRAGVDMALLRQEHPEIDWPRYETTGEPYRAFNAYGRKAADHGESDVDDQIGGLHGELQGFATATVDVEADLPHLDELRNRTELYAGMLTAEAAALRAALDEAEKRFVKGIGI